jgi:Neuraminidase (sialidase)
MVPTVKFETKGQPLNEDTAKHFRQLLVGPWLNQPEEYEGYNGFVGFPSVTILRSGRWLMPFTSGSWHGSPPWTDEIAKNPHSRAYMEQWRVLDGNRCCLDIRSPRGGRVHLMFSDDQGKTWSKPETFINTDRDDRHPIILELDSGTLMCTFFTSQLPDGTENPRHHAKYIMSQDGGQTWTEPTEHRPINGGSACPAIQLADGKVIWIVEQQGEGANALRVIGVYGSNDRGQIFNRLSVVTACEDLNEPTIAELSDGRLVLLARRNSYICFSKDQGNSWTEPVSIGIDMFDPHFLLMPNGILACFHGSYKTGGLRVILSPDGGQTWHGPEENLGYAVDTTVYGYSHPVLDQDGTVFCVYQSTGGHLANDARTMALWGLRLRINDTADGIEILPSPQGCVSKPVDTDGGDPELGNLT